GDRPALLDQWEAELRRCYTGTPGDIRFVALQATIRQFDLPPEPFERLIEANRRDQRTGEYQTYEGLLEYCSYSANPVGRLVLAGRPRRNRRDRAGRLRCASAAPAIGQGPEGLAGAASARTCPDSEGPAMKNGLESAYDYCQELTRREAKNFYYGFVLLPSDQ